MFRITAAIVALGVGLGVVASLTQPSRAEDASAKAAFEDMQKTLGGVPGFFKLFPEAGVAGAWAEFKAIQLNPDTELDGKTKELLGLAVAAQIPCQYCIYFHTKAAKANGATDGEIREAVAMAAVVRHWSTVLQGMQVDLAGFKSEVDAMMGGAQAKPASTSN